VADPKKNKKQEIKDNIQLNKLYDTQLAKLYKIRSEQEAITLSTSEGSEEHKKALKALKEAKKEYDKIEKAQNKIKPTIESIQKVQSKVKQIESDRADKTKELNKRFLQLNKREKKTVDLYKGMTSLTQGVSDKMKLVVALQEGWTRGGDNLKDKYGASYGKLEHIGDMMEGVVKGQDKSGHLALEMAENWEKVGSTDYISQLDKVKELEEEAAAKRREYNAVISAGNYPPELQKIMKAELLTLDKSLVALRAKATEMDGINDVASEAQKYLTKPFDMMKGAMERLPFGGVASSIVGLDDVQADFVENTRKSMAAFIKSGGKNKLMLNNIQKQGEAAFKTLATGFKTVTKGAYQFAAAALANPYVAVAAAIALIGVLLYKAMNYAEAMRQEFGVTRGDAFEIQASVDATATSFKMLGVSAEDVGTMAQGIADSMGGVSNITQENLSAMANLTALYGMSADSIAPAMTAMKALGAESNEAASAQLAQIGHMAQLEGVAPAKVFADITANMGTFSRFGKEGGKNLAKASIMARKLGTSLESMAATSDALLDFESNINDQMEASMLTGRMINMDKARELALAGDIAGQEREILKQIGTQAEFEKMNVVQRDALAKATGKSTEDLASMLANQANLNAMTAEERAEKERMQRADEKVNKGMKDMGSMLGDLFKQAMEPLKELMVALGPTLGAILKVLAVTLKVAWAPLKVVFAILNPIIKLLGWMLDLTITIGEAIMKVLVFPFQLLWKGIKSAFGLLMTVVKAPFNFIIAGVNAMINGLNALSITVPDWVPLIGGKQFGFNLPPVPSLESKVGGPGHNVTKTGVAEVHKGESVGTFDMSKVEGKLDQVIDLLGQTGPIAAGVGGVKSNTKSIADQIV
jgi:hypothetical protein